MSPFQCQRGARVKERINSQRKWQELEGCVSGLVIGIRTGNSQSYLIVGLLSAGMMKLQTGWLIKRRHWSFTALEGGESNFFWGPWHGRKHWLVREDSCAYSGSTSSQKATNPVAGASPSRTHQPQVTSQRPHIQTRSDMNLRIKFSRNDILGNAFTLQL